MALVFAKNETRPTMNVHKFINYELEFHLNNLYISIKEEIMSMLDERNDTFDNKSIKEANNV